MLLNSNLEISENPKKREKTRIIIKILYFAVRQIFKEKILGKTMIFV
jgi:hypothetical protein